ncbi:MAG: exopolyphosphatase [Alphaproteobacteria bacterium]|nr:exopolyphosphatase [Alphaproteobacteria bacterium]MDE2336204.1 exopolyphosphatase [Alphaproteobacteria bacterium]
MSQKYRLITRSDLDGIVCAALLKEAGMVDEITFAHPKDMQDGTIAVTGNDIITNLPYHPNAHMVFDHHASEAERNKTPAKNMVNDPNAPSAAAVVYKHLGGAAKFPGISKELLDAANKIDSAQLTESEILEPHGWVLLGFIMDNRTGLGRLHQFQMSNYNLMLELVDILRKEKSIDGILANPHVAERVKVYHEHAEMARHQIKKCASMHDKLLVIDLRSEPMIYCINRFAVYALYPAANISMHVLPGKKNQNTVFAVGKSVLNRSAKVDVGSLMLKYGGGGHKAVGTCQIPHHDVDTVKDELIRAIVKAG